MYVFCNYMSELVLHSRAYVCHYLLFIRTSEMNAGKSSFNTVTHCHWSVRPVCANRLVPEIFYRENLSLSWA